MKKFLSVILSLSMIFAVSVPAFAADDQVAAYSLGPSTSINNGSRIEFALPEFFDQRISGMESDSMPLSCSSA